MFEIKPYTPQLANEWNAFVAASRNGTFLLDRQFMDYHSNRFDDASLLFYRKGKLAAVLPGNVRGDTYYSHEGLTYGGLLVNTAMRTAYVLTCFELLQTRLKAMGIKKLVYKPTPWFYHTRPTEEDVYALFKLGGANLVARGVSSVIFLPATQFSSWRKLRMKGVKKAEKQGVEVGVSQDYEAFWKILDHNLSTKYHTHPAHKLEEIKLLATRFPHNIQLFTAMKQGEMVAGVVVFFHKNQTVHTQYIAASPEGKKCGALDLIIYHLVDTCQGRYQYFDFGVSVEQNGHYLNENLIAQKEGFDASAACYDTYEWML